MRVAILSDTHDNVMNTRAAIALLRPHAPDAWIHCGDVCDPEMLAVFRGLPMWFVFGNNDWDKAGLRAAATDAGLTCLGEFGEVTLGGKTFAVLHGDDLAARHHAALSGPYDYVLSGHTHKTYDARRAGSRARQINPGALHRASQKTVDLLDVATDGLTFLTLGPREQ
jgi:putative phosphoesterase